MLPVLVAEKGLIIFYKLLFFFFYIIHLQYALQDSNTDRKKVLKMFYFENLLDSYWSVALTGSVSKVLGTKSAALAAPQDFATNGYGAVYKHITE